ncbi:MBL fold metallo-hydrolase [Tundrisphaera lichenicola]|uniref:MBL fold metallo-hydrolase n=1 Tax=Tundrisphaera lichenicola TaxID=2029860 RepID=UPI003EB717F9
MSGPNYELLCVESAPFAENAYVLRRAGGSEALVVDPSFDTDPIFEFLDREGLNLSAILNTHGHADHIAGNASIKEIFPNAPLIIGRNDAPLLTDPEANLSAPFGMPLTSPPADRLVDHGERIELAGFSFEVREIPGHSPGSVVFVCLDGESNFVLGGDVLFAGSVGRTDLAYGDGPLLFAGIRSKLFDLPDSTVVYPGHGPETTIGRERRTNPFVGENPGTYRLD